MKILQTETFGFVELMKYNEKYFFESISFGLPLSSLSLTGTVADAIISDSVSFLDLLQSVWLLDQAVFLKMGLVKWFKSPNCGFQVSNFWYCNLQADWLKLKASGNATFSQWTSAINQLCVTYGDTLNSSAWPSKPILIQNGQFILL